MSKSTAQPAVRTDRVAVGDIAIELLRAGNGPPLLFLHGAGSAGRWLPAHADLARSYSVYLPSHPGFGASDWPDWLDGVDDLVFHYTDFLDAFGLDRPVVIGASLGGWIAAELALARPDRIGPLVLVNAAGLYVPSLELPDVFPLTPEQVTRLYYHDPARVEAAIAALADRSPESTARANRDRAATARLAWQPYFADLKLRRRLHRIRTRTLVLWGANDRIFPVALGAAYAEGIPNARLVTIPGCGHAPHDERPAEFVRAVRDFLDA